MSINEAGLRRLLLAKTLLDETRTHPVADPDEVFLAKQILSTHDAAELALASIADSLGVRPSKDQSYLMNYFMALEKAVRHPVNGHEYMSQLNRVRTDIKHFGILPSVNQWGRVAEQVYGFVAGWCEEFLNLKLDKLDQSALLVEHEIREIYHKATLAAQNHEYEQALIKIALALHLLFDKTPALRGFHVGVARSEDALKLTGFGVHANDYLALQEFLPSIEQEGESLNPVWVQSKFGHPANWREASVRFCLRAFLDTALKIQHAKWIPGAIDFDFVYEYKVSALEPVDVWKDPPPTGGSAEVAFSLQQGESVTASDVKFLDSKDFRTLLTARYLSLSGLGPTKEYESVLELSGMKPPRSLVGYVTPTKVRVTCVPKQDESIRRYLPHVAEIEWQRKAD
jgi:hypothetical protein